jgi:hypothetical protein
MLGSLIYDDESFRTRYKYRIGVVFYNIIQSGYGTDYQSNFLIGSSIIDIFFISLVALVHQERTYLTRLYAKHDQSEVSSVHKRSEVIYFFFVFFFFVIFIVIVNGVVTIPFN